MTGPVSSTAAFDAAAAGYDATFTDTLLGRCYRAAVDRSLRWAFVPGQRVLELNCGTGVDAVALAGRGVEVLATDASPAMVDLTHLKARAAGVGERVTARVMAIEDLGDRSAELGRFDGVLSNFGGLNCVADLAPVAADLAGLVRPQGRAVLCVMGPLVPWEWAWFMARGRPGTAVRRLRRDVSWRGMPLRYPSVGAASHAFAPWFEVHARRAVGILLPPPYAESLAARHPRVVGALDRVERRFEAVPGAPWFADHYVLELVRR